MCSVDANTCSRRVLTRTPVRASLVLEHMFVQDGAQHSYPRPQRRRGWGRILVLTAALLLVSGRLAYGSGPAHTDRVLVAAGDTVWSIAPPHPRRHPPAPIEARPPA